MYLLVIIMFIGLFVDILFVVYLVSISFGVLLVDISQPLASCDPLCALSLLVRYL